MSLQNALNQIVHGLLRERFRFVERHGPTNDVASKERELVAHSHQTMRTTTPTVCREQNGSIVEQFSKIIRLYGEPCNRVVECRGHNTVVLRGTYNQSG